MTRHLCSRVYTRDRKFSTFGTKIQKCADNIWDCWWLKKKIVRRHSVPGSNPNNWKVVRRRFIRNIYGLYYYSRSREIDVSMAVMGDVMTRVDISSSTCNATRRKYPEALKAIVLHVLTATTRRLKIVDICTASVQPYIGLHLSSLVGHSLSSIVEDKRKIDLRFGGSERTCGR